MGLSDACPLLFSHVQSPSKGSPFVVVCALISLGAGALAAAGAGSWPAVDELNPGEDGVAPLLAGTAPPPATSAFSASFNAAVSLLSANDAALACFTSTSNSSMRRFSASISCSTVGFSPCFEIVDVAGAV